MKNLILIVGLLMAFKLSNGQQKRLPAKATVTINDSVRTVNINRDATAMIKATLESNFAVLVKQTHPLVVQMMGGADKMTAYLTTELKKMQQQGFAITDATTGSPGKIIAVGEEYYCVVPQKVVMKFGDRRVSVTSSLLGLSVNNGATWRFVDAGAMTDGQIKQYFPKVYGKLDIPKRSEPKEIVD